MDEVTLIALRGSIQKWEAIIAGTGTDEGPNNCPLCQLFHSDFLPPNSAMRGCEGCPVYLHTGITGCSTTPYDRYEFAETAAEELEAAKAELKFLKSLLPE